MTDTTFAPAQTPTRHQRLNGLARQLAESNQGWDPNAVGPNTRTTLMDAWERTAPPRKPIHPLVWAFLTVTAFLSIWAVIFTGNHLTHIHRVAVQTQDAYLTCYDAQGQEIPRSAGNAPFKECKRSHVL